MALVKRIASAPSRGRDSPVGVKPVAPELADDSPRSGDGSDEVRVRHIRPGDADVLSLDPVPEIGHKVPGVETRQGLAGDPELFQFPGSLGADCDHAGPGLEPGLQ